MISFYPGPSRVYDDVSDYVKEAQQKGILSLNHRSSEFMAIMEKTVRLLKKKLEIPENFTVLFTSSATECWEIIAQSLIKEQSLHIFNGTFGKKWFEYTKRLKPSASSHRFGKDEVLVPESIKNTQADIICLTHNETSNGTFVDASIIKKIKDQHSASLIAVDATSSMAGVFLDFETADVWFASVQKCFGLPAGLGILICSPKAIERMSQVNDQRYYNSLIFLYAMSLKSQTSFTPNVLSIYLLMRSLKKRKGIRKMDNQTTKRFERWSNTLKNLKTLHWFIQNSEVRSKTVMALEGKENIVESVKSKSKKQGFLLGEGYGNLNKSTIRIANFPALRNDEIKKLREFLKSF